MDLIGYQCLEIETCRNKNKGTYQLVKDLTSEKQGRSSTIQDYLGNVLLKNKRFSAEGQKIAQNYTTVIVVVIMQFWTATSLQKIYTRSSVRKLRLQ